MTSPYRLYQFFLQSEDAVVGQYLRYFTFLPHDEIAALDDETAEHPERRAAQRALARAVVELVHGAAEAERAERASAALFGEEIAALDERDPARRLRRRALERRLPPGAGRRRALAGRRPGGHRAGPSRARPAGPSPRAAPTSTTAGRRDEARVLTAGDLLHDRYVVLRRGRRDYHLLRVG